MPVTNKKAVGRLIVVGGLNMDIVFEAKSMPHLGEYAYVDSLHFIPGGNGLNIAVAAARLGSDVKIVGFIGEDGVGKDLTEFLKAEGVDTTSITTTKNINSGVVAFILTNKEERHLVYPGSNMKVTIANLPEFEINASDIVIASLTVPLEVIKSAFERAKKVGAKTMFNLFPNYPVSKELLRLSDYVILNEVELAFRTGDSKLEKCQHKDLFMDNKAILEKVKKLRTHDGQTFIVTLAARGVVGINHNTITEIKGIKVQFKDATGAGDCFLGAFATGIAEDKDFKSALELANSTAAISVQKTGTTSSYPFRKEVDALLKSNK